MKTGVFQKVAADDFTGDYLMTATGLFMQHFFLLDGYKDNRHQNYNKAVDLLC